MHEKTHEYIGWVGTERPVDTFKFNNAFMNAPSAMG